MLHTSRERLLAFQTVGFYVAKTQAPKGRLMMYRSSHLQSAFPFPGRRQEGPEHAGGHVLPVLQAPLWGREWKVLNLLNFPTQMDPLEVPAGGLSSLQEGGRRRASSLAERGDALAQAVSSRFVSHRLFSLGTRGHSWQGHSGLTLHCRD